VKKKEKGKKKVVARKKKKKSNGRQKFFHTKFSSANSMIQVMTFLTCKKKKRNEQE